MTTTNLFPLSTYRFRRRPFLALTVGGVLLAALVGSLSLGRSDAADPPTKAPSKPLPTAAASKQTSPVGDAQDDIAAKAAILQGPRWRRAIFELGEWLSSQQIYPPKEVIRIKSDFNRRVSRMTSHELEYLLDDLEAKFKVMETPEAQEARAWVGQYLSAMSDRRRDDVLKDVPNVVDMTAGQLSQEIGKIEQKRQSLKDRQAAFDDGRQVLVAEANANRQLTAQASAAATSRMNSGPSYSPYRSGGGGGGGGGGGKKPFDDVHGGGITVYSGGMFGGGGVAMTLGGF
ncbi:MAG: hypothetical protein DWH79_09675 [Planctomycetota bacterium]|nr:MAG: hypothetical protein DWH79_09675 [Planctomycetota bacterium]